MGRLLGMERQRRKTLSTFRGFRRPPRSPPATPKSSTDLMCSPPSHRLQSTTTPSTDCMTPHQLDRLSHAGQLSSHLGRHAAMRQSVCRTGELAVLCKAIDHLRVGNETMHPSARNHMQLCISNYLRSGKHYDVIDFGSRAAGDAETTTHRDLFTGLDCTITGVDVTEGHHVDVVMKRPYRIPLKSNSIDVIVSGQTFEHIPFFWVSFLEMCRVLRPGGFIFITAPSRGHIHGPVDPWRYYPDAMRVLAAFGRMQLVEAHTDLPPTVEGSQRYDYAAIDERSAYWGDSVGVFRKPKRYSSLVRIPREVLIWWANRVEGVDHIERPASLPARRGSAVHLQRLASKA